MYFWHLLTWFLAKFVEVARLHSLMRMDGHRWSLQINPIIPILSNWPAVWPSCRSKAMHGKCADTLWKSPENIRTYWNQTLPAQVSENAIHAAWWWFCVRGSDSTGVACVIAPHTCQSNQSLLPFIFQKRKGSIQSWWVLCSTLPAALKTLGKNHQDDWSIHSHFVPEPSARNTLKSWPSQKTVNFMRIYIKPSGSLLHLQLEMQRYGSMYLSSCSCQLWDLPDVNPKLVARLYRHD